MRKLRFFTADDTMSERRNALCSSGRPTSCFFYFRRGNVSGSFKGEYVCSGGV